MAAQSTAKSAAETARAADASIETRRRQARQFAVDAARLAEHTRCHAVTILDVSGLSPVTDFFVLASGTSARQMRTVANELAELGEKLGYRVYRTDGYESANWILVDFVDVVIHLFTDEARRYYDLESLWGDAQRVELAAEPPAD